MPAPKPHLFPATRAHAGVWEGTYTHINARGEVEDRHRSLVECEFPENHDNVFYRQRIRFDWPDGHRRQDVFEGVIEADRLVYNTPTFHGSSWETHDGLVVLNLQRKDEPGAHFIEIIIMGEDGHHRARTWHWFRNGALYRRTLCDETRIAT